GFCSRKEYLDELLKEAEFKYFIVPTNKDNGNLEVILDSIVSAKGKAFYSCLSDYINGLLDLKNENIPQYILDNPNLTKEKINWYIYMMLGKSTKNKEGVANAEIWDLSSAHLGPLKTFFNEVLV
ncbi:MAG TPA: DUF3226 domain-containing protein, partial [Verrucomicrobiae bacterium]|nr:DUF3226 domain-containing protein [Verrucomicrobiae bacterium]